MSFPGPTYVDSNRHAYLLYRISNLERHDFPLLIIRSDARGLFPPQHFGQDDSTFPSSVHGCLGMSGNEGSGSCRSQVVNVRRVMAYVGKECNLSATFPHQYDIARYSNGSMAHAFRGYAAKGCLNLGRNSFRVQLRARSCEAPSRTWKPFRS